jgi:benzoylformate decarboxylase
MGPVFLSLPGDVLDASADIKIGKATRVNTQVLPNQETLNILAQAILNAKNPAIVAGHEVASRDALDEAGDLALTMGAAVFQQTVPYSAQFKSEHPAFLGALSRNQKACREQLEAHDLVLFLGSDVLRMSVFSEIDPLPPHIRLMQIGERDWELGKNYPAEFAIRANVKETTPALTNTLRSMMNDSYQSSASERLIHIKHRNWSSKRTERVIQAQSFDKTVPINTLKLVMELAKSIPDRPIVALVGDGSSMYSIQALWTAAHLKRPITYVIPNNQGYKILKQRLMSFRGTDKYIGMNITDPAIDYVKLSESMGVPAMRIENPSDLNDALTRATRSNRANLIEVMISTDIHS